MIVFTLRLFGATDCWGSSMTPKYEIELWVNGERVADISKLALDRKFLLKRNASEEFTFRMDIDAFEAYCASAGINPRAILEAYVTDVLVKRNGEYYFGTQIVDMPMTLDESGNNVSVLATGYLDLFKDRYITKSYTSTERTEIFRDVIETVQVGDFMDWGILPGTVQYETDIDDAERTYVDMNVRDLLINLTDLSDGNFDFRFNPDRTYEIFERIGTIRSSKFTFPYNVDSLAVAHGAGNLFNYIIGLGSGFGEEALRNETADAASRGNYGTRQKPVSFNSVSVQDTLDKNTYAYLQKVSQILELPKLRVNGAFANLDSLSVGDTVPVEVVGHSLLPLDDMYRIEQIECTLDENDEETIEISVDNFSA